jgi:hypothetical protein
MSSSTNYHISIICCQHFIGSSNALGTCVAFFHLAGSVSPAEGFYDFKGLLGPFVSQYLLGSYEVMKNAFDHKRC